METCYIYVTSDPYFHSLWPWQKMIDILPNLSNKKAKWFAIETLAELCSIGQQGKKDLLQKLNENNEDTSIQNCLDYLYSHQNNLIKLNPTKTSTPALQSDSLCRIENVLLPSLGNPSEDMTFVPLPNRRRILEEIASSIAERKHSFVTVSLINYLLHIFF